MADLVAKFSLNKEDNIDAIFKIDAAGTTWGNIDGSLSNQTDLYNALNLKADKSTVEADFEALSDTVTENYTVLDNKITGVQLDLSGDITALSSTVTANNTAVNNRINTTNSNLSTLQTTVNDNNTAINKRVNTLETSFDANIEKLNTHLSDLADTVGNNYTDLSGQISETNVNLVSLSTTVSSNYTTLDNKINGINSELSGNIGELGTELTELTTTVANNNTTINQKVDTLETTLTGDINTLSGTVSDNYTTLNTKIDNEVNDLTATITTEATTRENADNSLQSQIDAITAASDVVDIVGTYAALQAYNTSNLQNNDIIKVLSDESRNNETTYYRWIITDGVGVWSFIGEEGPYYTKSEVDSQFVPQTRTINNKALSDNITLTASDVNALSDTTVIGDGVLTLQKNGVNIDTFNANATANKSINIEIPTALSEFTNDTGFITGTALNGYATENFVINQGYITGVTSSDITSALGYTPYNNTNPNGYITSASIMDYYGTCATAAATRAKVVVCPNFELKIGVSIRVKFTNSQTYNGSATLNVNNTGAIVVRSSGTANSVRYCWYAGEVVAFTYDGEYYVMEDSHIASTTYYGYTKLSSSAASTSASMALTPAALNSSLQYTTTGIPIYSATSTYKVGDKARYTYYMYECNTDIDEPEAWNAEHWTVLDPLLTQIERKQNALISGTNIKTINNISLLGEGDITINPSPDIDNTSITKNTDDELQAVGVIDENAGATLKAWKGTATQFNAIETKSENTFYYVYDAGQIYCGNVLISNNYSQNVGAVVTSILPLTDAGLHLLDGALLQGEGIYKEFVEYVAKLYDESTASNCFTTETLWQESVSKYGVCGKFVYDSENNTVRLPKITGIIEGTTDVSALGDLIEAGLPNITGTLYNWGWAFQKANSGAISTDGMGTSNNSPSTAANTSGGWAGFRFNAANSNSIYGNSSTVQPQTIKVLYYIVVATSAKTDIQVNMDEIATDLNNKADTDFSNVEDNAKVMMSNMGSLEDGWTALTITNGATYTAPADGLITFYCIKSTAGYTALYNMTKGFTSEGRVTVNGTGCSCMVPVAKGDQVRINFDGVNSNAAYRFYYTKGGKLDV